MVKSRILLGIFNLAAVLGVGFGSTGACASGSVGQPNQGVPMISVERGDFGLVDDEGGDFPVLAISARWIRGLAEQLGSSEVSASSNGEVAYLSGAEAHLFTPDEINEMLVIKEAGTVPLYTSREDVINNLERHEENAWFSPLVKLSLPRGLNCKDGTADIACSFREVSGLKSTAGAGQNRGVLATSLLKLVGTIEWNGKRYSARTSRVFDNSNFWLVSTQAANNNSKEARGTSLLVRLLPEDVEPAGAPMPYFAQEDVYDKKSGSLRDSVEGGSLSDVDPGLYIMFHAVLVKRTIGERTVKVIAWFPQGELQATGFEKNSGVPVILLEDDDSAN